ncbi:hypothetical protein [Desulfonema magnum]|uniref:Uncharacterized protein n=1 Tax=Desulfonema magnum TaxID=45655 RepID=A0A975BPH3_9BACT|nr:hypothetical protein [Desulfonema magnum]QTA89241.1 Uncharacterized protein dnm_052910 [Desulfonema magnum]
MAKYYLRMEAVNLYAFIGDTYDLSTIRGGGLLLLESAKQVQTKFSSALTVISTGASIGFFSFEAEDDANAEALRRNVAEFLRNDENLQHATFVVDFEKADKDFLQTREMVLAKNRWRQFQQPTVVIPEPNEHMDHFCPLDKVRPGTEKSKVKGKEEIISKSVAQRRSHGIDQKKRDFYISEIGEFCGSAITADFVSNLESLTDDTEQGNLHHKMAVIYLDGNGFTKIRNKYCNDENTLRQFDIQLRGFRADALKALLDRMDDGSYRDKDERYRLETLLWGGDELIWVVPAWKGWNVLDCFYTASASWEFAGQRLTHAGAMVFCHHKAPIHRITHLCQDLADSAKAATYFKLTRQSFSALKKEGFPDLIEKLTSLRDTVYEGKADLIYALSRTLEKDQFDQHNALILKHAEKAAGREQNLFQYLVLESFDHIGSDLETYRNLQCPIPWKISFSGEDMADMADNIRALKADFPRGQIYKAVHSALFSVKENQEQASYYDQFEERLKQILPEEVFNKAEKLISGGYFGTSPGAWLHLAELWDYIPEEEKHYEGSNA